MILDINEDLFVDLYIKRNNVNSDIVEISNMIDSVNKCEI